jgi:trehalose synthase
MRLIEPRPVSPDTVGEFLRLLGPDRAARMVEAAALLRERLDGGTLWHVNSTDAGGGVAEMLHVLVPLYRALGVPVRWAVVEGDERFFDITKRLGSLVYGSEAESDLLSPAEVDVYLAHLAGQAAELRVVVGPADTVLLHDHQTAGLAPVLPAAAVHWRCHVGVDEPTSGSVAGWAVIAALLDRTDGVVFSIERHVPAELDGHPVAIVPPVLWPFSPKNRPIADEELPGLLDRCGLDGDDLPGHVVADGPWDPQAPLVVQVSRWDRLKDMHGVLTGFARSVPEARLALIGPDPDGIPDDVEQAHWFTVCHAAWQSLPGVVRARIRLVCLPMDDLDDNAVLVNAAQRAATVVTQKSLAEGFGLTVTEAMWKSRAVVASAVGGIATQIRHRRTGLLLDDPYNLQGFAALVGAVTGGAVDGAALGAGAHATVRDHYLPDSDVLAMQRLLAS